MLRKMSDYDLQYPVAEESPKKIELSLFDNGYIFNNNQDKNLHLIFDTLLSRAKANSIEFVKKIKESLNSNTNFVRTNRRLVESPIKKAKKRRFKKILFFNDEKYEHLYDEIIDDDQYKTSSVASIAQTDSSSEPKFKGNFKDSNYSNYSQLLL